MSFIDAIDVSNYQEVINWAAVPQQIVILKASEGTSFLDPYLFRNYDEAKHKNGKAVGMYHFASGGDPVAEAEFFIRCCQPLEQDDVFALDWEIDTLNPVSWCTAFVNRVHELTGTWPLFYTTLGRLNNFNWSPVLQNCGLWIAEPDYTPDQDVPTGGREYVLHQYGEAPVPGISGSVDKDAWFGTLAQFKKYGWQSAVPPVTPAPVPAPAPTPAPVPTPVPPPTPVPAPTPTPVPSPVDPPTPQLPASLSTPIKAVLVALGVLIAAVLVWIH